MGVDHNARHDLQTALIAYMAGEIRSYEFDDAVDTFYETKATDDDSVRRIAHFLWSTYDDLIDHPVSVTQEGWASYRRILAFLATDLEIVKPPRKNAWRHDQKEWWRNGWPFRDHEEWLRNEARLDEIALPEYDPAIHGRPANPWWNRIPSSAGFAVLAGIVLGLLFILSMR